MSDSITKETVYFTSPGPKNTQTCLQAAAKRAKDLDLKKVLLATCSGWTVYQALEIIDPLQIKCFAVTHVTGFKNPNEQEMPQDVRQDLIGKGVTVHTAAHAFGSVGRGIRTKLNTFQVDELMAFTLRMFGQGVKVGVELALMCADAGLVRTDEDVLTITGTGKGADTAMVIQPSNSHNCLETKVREIIAKPR